ncbi:sensor histidine kinase [Rufibacter psychrotolerans]|uniref:sensor histidine kinase n=1 Tax=Rufibacter psychrotolerans TaxID=2812556 RepID=UPI00196820E8|nr:HAMP domain-containing sensor histidine kinase [Rufibacter sp. SYSU D00308]
MRKKTLLWVIVLMSISLIGLIGFQVYWIQHAVQMEEEVFDRNVNDALHQVARRLEQQEAVHFLKEEAPQITAAALTTDAPAPLAEAEPTVPAKPAKPQSREARKRQPRKAAPAPPAPVTASVGPPAVTVVPPQVLVTRTEALTQVYGMVETTRVKAPRTRAFVSGGQHIEIFGKGATDSVVVWKFLASQAKADSLLKKGLAQHFQRGKADQDFLYRLEGDTLTPLRQQEALRLLNPKHLKSIKLQGRTIDLVTDSLLGKQLRQSFTISVDSLQIPTRYVPAHSGKTWSGKAPTHSSPGFNATAQPARRQAVKQKTPAPAHSGTPEKDPHQKAQAKAQHLNQVMQQMAVEYVRKEKPLEERLQQLKLKELLANELHNRSISTPYRCSLRSVAAASKDANFVLASHHTFASANLRENEYAVRLFPNDVMTAPSFLLLNFPNRNLYVWQSLLLPSVISVLFTLIIILTFSFTLYTILRQKKISEIKNDFINNMTHEFKTPIATISLALDALVNPKVRSDEVRVDYYARIIRDENKRMHQQVEKVLQTAQMERQSIQLACERVDVHQLIRKAAEPFQLHIEQRQGMLDLKLEAQEPYVWADPGHLANMVANLLDNANKYSPTAPKIVIQTTTISKGLHISVEDQGVGMSREAQKRVFDKFYRVPTGNVHNVKGFGLGLSYVKTMAEAHAGSIHLRSELGKGSKFTLWLPFQKNMS